MDDLLRAGIKELAGKMADLLRHVLEHPEEARQLMPVAIRWHADLMSFMPGGADDDQAEDDQVDLIEAGQLVETVAGDVVRDRTLCPQCGSRQLLPYGRGWMCANCFWSGPADCCEGMSG